MRLRGIIICAIAVGITAAGTALAGGPFLVDQNGSNVALRWLDDTMKWCPDGGPLSSKVDHATGEQWVTDALKKWTDIKMYDDLDQKTAEHLVSTALVKTELDGGCDNTDINVSNYESIAFAETTDHPGRAMVIFDDDGSIIEQRLPGNREYVLGLSEPTLADASGLHIIYGYSIVNGLIQANGIRSDQCIGTSDDCFKAAIVHELGHLLGLDHSQVNLNWAQYCDTHKPCIVDSQNGDKYIPTMYPKLISSEQGTPKIDDMVTMSWIYPTSDFNSRFCTITGEIFDGNGEPLKGVNVIASNAGSYPKSDARSFVSGVLSRDPQRNQADPQYVCGGDSRYSLRGLVPGQSYTVSYEPIYMPEGSLKASGFEPLEKPPQGFEGGDILKPDGDDTVTCESGGQTIPMASVTIEVTQPYTCSQGSTSGKATSASSGCSMVGGQRDRISAALGFCLLAMGAAVLGRARALGRRA
jgi:hypothetical protein